MSIEYKQYADNYIGFLVDWRFVCQNKLNDWLDRLVKHNIIKNVQINPNEYGTTFDVAFILCNGVTWEQNK